MPESLNPTALHRLSALLRPSWSRTIAARRVAAALLVVLAAAAALRADPGGEHTPVVVAARDLSPGSELRTDDLTLESFDAATVPDGSQRDPTALVGARVAGPVRRGEVLTDARIVTPRLAESTAGPDARLVGVHPADSALLDVLRAGDTVDVLTADSDDTPRPRLLAGGAVVVLVSGGSDRDNGERLLLLALGSRAAADVAAAALVGDVTVTIR